MMRVFVAGAAGAIGRMLVPMLIADGHEVTGTTRSADRAGWLRDIGAHPVTIDVMDAGQVRDALVSAAPEVVIHQLTDLASGFDTASLERNARLREVGTGNLVDAMLAVPAGRLIAQSIAWLYADGPLPHTEADPLIDPASDPGNISLRGVMTLERLVTQTPGIDGLVLRYGSLYGPGTANPDRPAGPTSVHVGAAARAAALAVTRGDPGIYNVVDDGGAVSATLARRELGWDADQRT
jgi:nucleoside-diphosphate-sugar epimerase